MGTAPFLDLTQPVAGTLSKQATNKQISHNRKHPHTITLDRYGGRGRSNSESDQELCTSAHNAKLEVKY